MKGDGMGQLTASYDAGTAGAPLVGDTIGVALAKMVVAQPDVEALVSRHQGVRLSYAELGTQVEQVARGLLAVGIETGDRVGIWAPTCVEWTLLQFASRADRGDPRQRQPGLPAERARLRAPRTRACACSSPPSSFKTSDYLAMLAGVRDELPRSRWSSRIDGESAGGAKDLEWPAMVDLGARHPRRPGPRPRGCSSTPTTRSTSSTRAARRATRRAPRSRTTTS